MPKSDDRYKQLEQIILANPLLNTALYRMESLGISNYYIGAGCVTQTVWNHLTEQPLMTGIKDLDIVYFDDFNTSEEAESKMVNRIKSLLEDLSIQIDVKNQARVHEWYTSKFGYPIKPYTSVENAIDSWPTTASAIGVRLNADHTLDVYAPYGLDDLFEMRVRANKVQITEEIFLSKAEKWKLKWPELEIIPWLQS